MCTIKGCDAPAVAKGLCGTHYMRTRRHGNADTVQKRGRKPDEVKTMMKEIMQPTGWSPRTFERYWQATRLLEASGVEQKQQQQAIMDATRPVGSVNVSKLVGIAAMTYIRKKEKSRRRRNK